MLLSTVLSILGAALTVCGAAGVGVCLCRQQRVHVEELLLLEKFFHLAAGEITYGRTDLPCLFEKIGKRLEGELGEALFAAGKRMQDGTGSTLEEIWQDEIGCYLEETCLIKEEKELILSFPKEVGFLDGAQQQKELERMGEQIGARGKQLDLQRKSQEKLTMTLCLSGGIAVSILFW